MMESEKSVRTLVVDLIDGVNRLVRQEIRLAQAEGSETVSQAAEGAMSIGVGLVIALVALIVLAQALVVALAEFMAPALAAVVVAAVLAVIAFALIRHGKSVSLEKLTLPKTRATLRANAQMATEAMK